MTAHGTLQGYRSHRTHGTPPCQACTRAYVRLYGPDKPRADGKPVPAFDPNTRLVGWNEEKLASKDPDLRRRGLNAPQARVNCGSMAGWARHRRMREHPCQPCEQAAAEYRRDHRGGGPDAA